MNLDGCQLSNTKCIAQDICLAVNVQDAQRLTYQICIDGNLEDKGNMSLTAYLHGCQLSRQGQNVSQSITALLPAVKTRAKK
jgi:hypothetical protein